jgi:16S rRNA (cytosine967-C5)-methyltransferase
MSKASSRGLAFGALELWRKREQFADAILGQLLRSTDLRPADRAFATELFYGILRNLTLLDFWIGQLRSGHLDHETRDLLRLGLYQVLMIDTSEHAAVFETVALAGRRQRALVNAVLRTALREKARLVEHAAKEDLSVRKSHPQFLVDRWQRHFGDQETEALCQWNNEAAPIYARINRLKPLENDFLAGAARGDLVPNFVQLRTIPHDALAAGHCYIQDPSTAAACELLDPQSGQKILDACAAPGGKTGYVAELMQNQGFILACDRDSARVTTLEDNLQRLGVTIARCLRHDWSKTVTPPAEEQFDRILVDAPCTNTGVMRRRVDLRWRLRPEDFSRMPVEQLQIVRATLPLLKPGGLFVYSTCSIEPEENEAVVNAILAHDAGLEAIGQRSILPFRDGFDGAFAAAFRRA